MTTTCTYHCSACSRHFHSLKAFDIHHARSKTGWPICLDPIDLEDRDGKPRLVALTEHGECRLRGVTRDVVIWTRPQHLSPVSGPAGRLANARGHR